MKGMLVAIAMFFALTANADQGRHYRLMIQAGQKYVMEGGFVQGDVAVFGTLNMRGGFIQQGTVYLSPGSSLILEGGFIQTDVYCDSCNIQVSGGFIQGNVFYQQWN